MEHEDTTQQERLILLEHVAEMETTALELALALIQCALDRRRELLGERLVSEDAAIGE